MWQGMGYSPPRRSPAITGGDPADLLEPPTVRSTQAVLLSLDHQVPKRREA